MSNRFTIDGSDALEQHLETICEQVRHRLTAFLPSNKLEAIFLGGGYGRGEGGVLRTPQGDRPYNDLEFYICLKGFPRVNERIYGKQLHEIAEELTATAGLEVEFKVSSFAQLRSSSPTMFIYDLAMGHRTIHGDNSILGQDQFRDSAQIPLHEATRLLMNRCSGLLFSEEKLLHRPFTPDDADFVGRNHAKAQLAFGDVVLTALGKYHWSCRERRDRLAALMQDPKGAQLPVSLSKIVCHHKLGVEFKLHPKQMTGSAEEFLPLQHELRELGRNLWLWLESRRLKTSFSSVHDYVESPVNKCPETNSLKNRLVNLKQGGLRGSLGSKGGRYPRERIMHALSLLLWDPAARNREGALKKIQEELNTSSSDFARLVEAYFALWRHFN